MCFFLDSLPASNSGPKRVKMSVQAYVSSEVSERKLLSHYFNQTIKCLNQPITYFMSVLT